MTQQLKGSIRREKYLLSLCWYQEEMLDAFLQDDDYFNEMLRYSNIIYETLPYILNATHDLRKDKRCPVILQIMTKLMEMVGGGENEEI